MWKTLLTTEHTEMAQSFKFFSLCVLCALYVSVMNAPFILAQVTLTHY
jgi:hypothetical protein